MFDRFSRRSVLTGSLAAASGIPLVTAPGAWAQTPLAATPSCDSGPTLRQGEGPFFKPRSPERSDLREPGLKGEPIELTGLVLSRDCRPLERALVDLWHADREGEYDNAGFRLRGHTFTDAEGRFRFVTIVPAAYVGRTRHFHFKLQAPGSRLLTTQLYFPDEPKNRTDGLFRRELTMKVARQSDGLAGRFDFVLDMA
jgi:protocatechuate 3,4-dioxygenase beta subunit